MNPGDLVECICETFEDATKYDSVIFPRLHKIYTIRGARYGHKVDDCKQLYLLLEEIVNQPLTDSVGVTQEPAFDSEAFRPVRRNELAVFRYLAVPTDLETV